MQTPSPKVDLILWNEIYFKSEFTKYLKIDINIDSTLHQSILYIIYQNLGSFCEQGSPRPMFDFEFYTDTEDSKLVCNINQFIVFMKKLLNTNIQILEDNDQIYDCGGPCGLLLILATKLHQENFTNTNDFVWRLWVSYRPLNSVTRSFEFLFPHCTESIGNIGNSGDLMYFISLDNHSDYHQIRQRQSHQKN